MDRERTSLLQFRALVEARGCNFELDADSMRERHGSSPVSIEVFQPLAERWDAIIRKGKPIQPETAQELTAWFLAKIDEDIRDIGDALKKSESEDTTEEDDERDKPHEKDTVRLDHLLRYEASLERSFDRTLNQLDRLQRQRRGQPVLPRIDVNVSTES